MALQDCKECGKKVSDKAQDCPNCGARVDSPINTARGVLALAILGVTGWGIYQMVVGLNLIKSAF